MHKNINMQKLRFLKIGVGRVGWNTTINLNARYLISGREIPCLVIKAKNRIQAYATSSTGWKIGKT